MTLATKRSGAIVHILDLQDGTAVVRELKSLCLYAAHPKTHPRESARLELPAKSLK
jgi:hypothetical protein